MSHRNESLFGQSAIQTIGPSLASMQGMLASFHGGGMAEAVAVFRRQQELFDRMAFQSVQAFKPSTSGLAAIAGVTSLLAPFRHWDQLNDRLNGFTGILSGFADAQKQLSGIQSMYATGITSLLSLPDKNSFFRAVRQPVLRVGLQRTARQSLESCLGIVIEHNATVEDSGFPLASVQEVERQTAVSAATVVAFSLEESELEETDFVSIRASLFNGDNWTDLPQALRRLDPALERALIASRLRREKQGSPGYVEHAAISMRKLIERVLALLAPVEQVQAWLNSRPLPLPERWTKKNGQPGQTGQMAYLLRHIEAPATGEIQEFYFAQVRMASMLLRHLHDCAHDVEYKISHPQFLAAQLQIEGLLRMFLRFHFDGR